MMKKITANDIAEALEESGDGTGWLSYENGDKACIDGWFDLEQVAMILNAKTHSENLPG